MLLQLVIDCRRSSSLLCCALRQRGYGAKKPLQTPLKGFSRYAQKVPVVLLQAVEELQPQNSKLASAGRAWFGTRYSSIVIRRWSCTSPFLVLRSRVREAWMTPSSPSWQSQWSTMWICIRLPLVFVCPLFSVGSSARNNNLALIELDLSKVAGRNLGLVYGASTRFTRTRHWLLLPVPGRD